MPKKFLPVYKVIIKFHAPNNDKVYSMFEFEVDYFKKDINGRDMFDIILYNWSVPFDHTSIDFIRL